MPVCLGLTDAGMHDRKDFKQIITSLPANMLTAMLIKLIKLKLNRFIKNNQLNHYLTGLVKKTGIQIASKVRSYQDWEISRRTFYYVA